MARRLRSDPALVDQERFALEGELGAGAMGVVYEAFDKEREMRVALKSLRKIDPATVYRFKREFRTMADVVHPNLVTLHELISAEDRWFFTMELVDGIDLLSYVRGLEHGDPDLGVDTASGTGDDVTAADPTTTLDTIDSAEEGETVPPPVDYHRLRRAFEQLVRGLHALHEAGFLHRDVKPRNVLVTPEGRVVLLDFGIITELAHAADERAGTPAYMSPEQAAGRDASRASDWYSVGVLLYEALVGRRPFAGSAAGILAAKQRGEPQRPSSIRADVPVDLDALCSDLLARRPDRRPGGPEILARLGVTTDDAPAALAPLADVAGTGLVGRDTELDVLREAFAEAVRGSGVRVFVAGAPGMGKTALVRSFLDEIRERSDAIVLAGRCYERETVPFKAVDSLVDSLSRYLVGLPRADADRLLPRDVVMLARMFPVLRRVEAIAEARGRGTDTADPLEVRRRAFAALRDLFGRIAERHPLVLFLDDLQWGDVDSAPLLTALVRPPDEPPMMLIASYRDGGRETSALLDSILDESGPLAAGARHIAVTPLDDLQATAVVESLLPVGTPDRGVRAIVREARGYPFYLHQLAHFLAEGVSDESLGPDDLTIQGVVRARVRRLAKPTASLLEMIAVAGKPIPQRVLAKAAGLGRGALEQLQQLNVARLIKLTGTRADDLVEPAHDRILETVLEGLARERRRAHHHRLALALETERHPDAESLAFHHRGAGADDQAARYAELAAEQAERALAFDRAVALYRLALDARGEPRDPELERRLADALVNAGYGAEAAALYIEAAELEPAADALDLRRRAAFEFLKSGHFEKGLEVLRDVLKTVGLPLSRSPRRAITSFLWSRIIIRLRGLRWKRRDLSDIPPREIARVDVLWASTIGIGMVDTVRSTSFQAKHILMALRLGEPYRVGRALCTEILYNALPNPRSRRRSYALLPRVYELVEELESPFLRGLTHGAHALTDYLAWSLESSVEQSTRSNDILRSEATGVWFEITTIELYRLWALFWLGEIRELSWRVHTLLEEGRLRGDLYTQACIPTGLPGLAWLMADDVRGSRAAAERAVREWTTQGYHLQHYWVLLTQVSCDLYDGDGEAAYRRLLDEWPALRWSMLMTIESVRVETLHMRGRAAALLAASDPSRRRALLRDARRCARKLHRERSHVPHILADTILAALATVTGDDARAVELLEAAEAAAAAAKLGLVAASAKRQRGILVGGDEGDALVAEADAWMREQTVARPDLVAAMMVPLPRQADALPPADPDEQA